MPVADQRVPTPDGCRNEKELSQAIGTLSNQGLNGAAEYTRCGSTVAHVPASGQNKRANTEPLWVLPYCGASLEAPSIWISDGWLAFSAKLRELPLARPDPETVSSEMSLPSSS